MSMGANEYHLGKVAGLQLTVIPLAIVGSVVLFIVLSAIGVALFNHSFTTAIVGSLMAVVLHWLADTWHQLGHAFAARSTGHPMSGVRFGFMGLLSNSLYPPDEKQLPARIHIQRALGGPIGSFVLSIISAFIAFALSSAGGILWLLALFFLFDNFVIFTLGSLTPLGFTDGSTILHWLRK